MVQTNMRLHECKLFPQHIRSPAPTLPCSRSALDPAGVQKYPHLGSLHTADNIHSHISEGRSGVFSEAKCLCSTNCRCVGRTHQQCSQHSRGDLLEGWRQEVLLGLTMELGGKFFLNFALTTPTLP